MNVSEIWVRLDCIVALKEVKLDWIDSCIVVINDTYDSLPSPKVSPIVVALAAWLRESSSASLYDGPVYVDVVSPKLTPRAISTTVVNPASLLNFRLVLRSSDTCVVDEHA